MQRSDALKERQTVLGNKAYISESKMRDIGNTTYNVGLTYREKGETIRNLLLQLMKENQQH